MAPKSSNRIFIVESIDESTEMAMLKRSLLSIESRFCTDDDVRTDDNVYVLSLLESLCLSFLLYRYTILACACTRI